MQKNAKLNFPQFFLTGQTKSSMILLGSIADLECGSPCCRFSFSRTPCVASNRNRVLWNQRLMTVKFHKSFVLPLMSNSGGCGVQLPSAPVFLSGSCMHLDCLYSLF